MTGPMPSLLPGYRCWTAFASTWAAEWRITSSSDWERLLPLWLMMEPRCEWLLACDTQTPPVSGRGGCSRFHPSSQRCDSESDPFDRLRLRPHTLTRFCAITRRLRGRLLGLETKKAVRRQV